MTNLIEIADWLLVAYFIGLLVLARALYVFRLRDDEGEAGTGVSGKPK